MQALAFDSVGRTKVTTLSTGTVPSTVVNGIAFDANGRVLMDPDAAAGNVILNVARYDAKQNIYTTQTAAATDFFVGGYRYSATGQLVCNDAGTPATFVNGQGFLATGALCTTEL